MSRVRHPRATTSTTAAVTGVIPRHREAIGQIVLVRSPCRAPLTLKTFGALLRLTFDFPVEIPQRPFPVAGIVVCGRRGWVSHGGHYYCYDLLPVRPVGVLLLPRRMGVPWGLHGGS